MLYFWDPAYLKISLFYQYLTIHFIEYGPILLWKSISPQPLRAWFYDFLPSSAASEKSEIIMLPFSFWILCMWPIFFFLQSILEFLSVVWNFIICIGVGQNNLKSFNSGLLSCIISLVISSPSIFSVLKLTKPLKLTP